MKYTLSIKLLSSLTALGIAAGTLGLAGCSNAAQPAADQKDSSKDNIDNNKNINNDDNNDIENNGEVNNDNETGQTVLESKKIGDTEVRLVQAFKTNNLLAVEPDYGNTFVIAEFQIKNNGTEEISVSSAMNFEGKADGEAVYPIIAIAPEDHELIDGTVAAGETKNGVLIYEAPLDFKTLEIEFKADPMSKETVSFKVNN